MKWHWPQLGQVAEVVSGFGFPLKYQGNKHGEFPFLKVGDMNTEGNEKWLRYATHYISRGTLSILKARPFPAGTVVFPKIGAAVATNKKRLLAQPSVVDNNVMGVIPKQLIESAFLYYWFLQFDLRSVCNIGPVPSVRKTDVERLQIPLPPLSEQRRIVEILDQADALRKKRAEADAKAARILPALFYKMFGDPATNPKGWPVRPLGDLIQFGPQNGLYKPATDYGTGTPILRIDSFDDGVLRSDRPLKRVRINDTELRTYGLRVGDIVVNRVNSPELLGKSTLIESLNEPTVFESNMMRLAVNPAIVRSSYIIHLLQTRAARNFLLTRSKRAVNQASINQDDVRAIPVPVPPPAMQVSFEEHWRKIARATSHQIHARVRLNSLFQVLLLRACEGSLTARWREAHMKELLAEMEAQSKLLEAVR
jgi:type I restriction enzyme S subunit